MTLPLKTVRLYLDVEVKEGKSLGPQASTLLVALTRMLITNRNPSHYNIAVFISKFSRRDRSIYIAFHKIVVQATSSSHRFHDLNTERRNSQYIMRCEKIIAL